MRKFEVAVILINYNTSQYTLDCINSIRKQTTSIRYQIVIVDNNSKAEEFVKLQSLNSDEQIQLIRSKLNVGFSGANMIGVQHANADYYYFLNNDTILLNDCLGILHRFMESTPDAANASGEMTNGCGVYEYNFRYFPTLSLKLFGSGLLRIFKADKYPSRHVRFKKPTRVDLVNGSSMFIRAIPFEAIGGFDTNYFLYCEEEDIALRLSRQGRFTYLVPEAQYQHFENKSSQSENVIRLPFLKEFYISFLYYFGKNYSGWYRTSIRLLYFFKTLRKFYKNTDYVVLAWFILRGAPVKESLRFKQQISSE